MLCICSFLPMSIENKIKQDVLILIYTHKQIGYCYAGLVCSNKYICRTNKMMLLFGGRIFMASTFLTSFDLLSHFISQPCVCVCLRVYATATNRRFWLCQILLLLVPLAEFYDIPNQDRSHNLMV